MSPGMVFIGLEISSGGRQGRGGRKAPLDRSGERAR